MHNPEAHSFFADILLMSLSQRQELRSGKSKIIPKSLIELVAEEGLGMGSPELSQGCTLRCAGDRGADSFGKHGEWS